MNNFPSIPMTTEETIEFNKWLEDHDKQIRADERKKIMEIIDSADDYSQAMYMVVRYLIKEELKE